MSKEKVLKFLNIKTEFFQEFGLYIFILFFISQGLSIYKLRVENIEIIKAAESLAHKVNESNERLLCNINEVVRLKKSFRDDFDKAKPLMRLFDSFQIENGDLKNFINQIKIDGKTLGINGFEDDSFFDNNPIANTDLKNPNLKELGLAEAYKEFLMRLNMNVFCSSVLYSRHKIFTRFEKENNLYHFYPNNFEINTHNKLIKINGETILDDYYLWKPNNKGTYYFDIEYIEYSNFRIYKKEFKISLKVV